MSLGEKALIGSFLILALIMLLKCYYPIVKGMYLRRKTENGGCLNIGEAVDGELAILGNPGSTMEKAKAFVNLMDLSYVLVHIMINQGNNYNDELQQKKFKKSLTPKVVNRLKELEGKYE